MINRLLSASSAHNATPDGIRAVFLTANFLFAMGVLVFVFFICVRMLSNTKTAGYATAGLIGCIFAYRLIWGGGMPSVLFENSIVGSIGTFCGLAAIAGIFRGLSEEEQAEEYIHGRLYWIGLLLLLYGSIILITLGMGTAN
mgnify:CR=1 FL=1